MIYAKCIRESQITYTHEQFVARQSEEYHVYCEGEVTESKNGLNLLCCVPLNLIYDCLKYGEYIAIIEYNSDETEYKSSSVVAATYSMVRQKVLKIMFADDIKTVKYVLDEVGDINTVTFGYIYYLSNDVKKYIKDEMKTHYKY